MTNFFPYFSFDRLLTFITPTTMEEMKLIFNSIELGEPINDTARILYEQFMTEEIIENFLPDIDFCDFINYTRIKNYDVYHNSKVVVKYGNRFDLMREYKIYKQLENEDCIPKLINIHKSYKRKDKYILTTEYIDGITLLEYIHSISFDYTEFTELLNTILLTLDSLYKKYNFCHYDLHADNILISKDNKIYFLDFEYSYTNDCVPTNHGAIYGIYNNKPNPSYDILKLCVSLSDLKFFKDIVQAFIKDFQLIDNTLIYYTENKLTFKDFYNILNGKNYYCTIL